MAINRTVDQKREALKRQLYGKEVTYSTPSIKSNSNTFKFNAKDAATTVTASDIHFLRKDLFKVLALSVIALTAQFSLFFAIQNHLVNINNLIK